jgi:hypothetical protein
MLDQARVHKNILGGGAARPVVMKRLDEYLNMVKKVEKGKKVEKCRENSENTQNTAKLQCLMRWPSGSTFRGRVVALM